MAADSAGGSDGRVRRVLLAFGVVFVALIVFVLGGGSTTDDRTPLEPAPADDGREITVSGRFSGLPAIAVDELPSEALRTLALIDAGGPYPYRQDDGVFENREGLLPDRDRGHYREYTVDTPGSPDRGARRIVAGEAGERYWTDDHYASFREIVGDRGG